MGVISVSLPSDGTTADAADYNTPITTIVNAINGNLDNSNIVAGAAIATSKLADDAGITSAKLATNAVAAANLATSAITLGYTQITSAFTASSGTLQDVTGLSVTVTVPTGGRRIEILAFMAQSYSSVDSDRMDWTIEEDGTTIGGIFNRMWTSAGGGNGGLTVLASKVASAGSHTYKLRVTRGLGTGVATVFAAATTPSFITVKAV